MNHEFNQEIFMNKSFKLASLAGAIALAMGSTAAFATPPTSTQLPGHGTVKAGAAAAVAAPSNGSQTINVTGTTVIDWGSTGGTINATGDAGFNVGSAAALHFAGQSTGGGDAVLNVDTSGNPSQIMGTLDDAGGVPNGASTPAPVNTSIFVANTNGIIVGSGAKISSGAEIGLIGNKTASDQSGFNGTAASIAYDGTGGDVTIDKAASVTGTTVYVSGGSNVNVDLGSFGSSTTVNVSAGTASAGAGSLAANNSNAVATVTGDQNPTESVHIVSAGNASNAGTVKLGAGSQVAGTFTNTGSLNIDGATFAGTLDNENTVTSAGGAITVGSLINNGNFGASGAATGALTTTAGGITNNGAMYTGAITTVKGGLTNNAQITSTGALSATGGDVTNNGALKVAGGITVSGGNVNNAGTVTDATGTATIGVTDGSIVNMSGGKMVGFNTFTTSSDANAAAAADYSITNSGSIQGSTSTGLSFDANSTGYAADVAGTFTNTSTGSFSSTGTLYTDAGFGLSASAHNEVSLAGSLMTGSGATATAVSAQNVLAGAVGLTAGGTLTVATPVFTSGAITLDGGMVKALADVSSAANVGITAGAATSDYAVRVAKGATVSGASVSIDGQAAAGTHPNVILQGTVSGNAVNFGTTTPVSDVFTGPVGGITATGTTPTVTFDFTGAIKNAKYTNDANFRYNNLPITVAKAGETLGLTLNPVAYATNGTDNGKSAVNVLVNGAVKVTQGTVDALVNADGTAVTGVTSAPNTHLVLQSTGDVEFASTNGGFYWPGLVYVGVVGTDAAGNAMPGTLGFGTITTDGTFNNVLPGDVSGASGIHFMSYLPLTLGGNVVTNANAWINFPTDVLTNAYANGTAGGSFYGGQTSSGSNVVTYGTLANTNFHTQAPNSSK